MDDNSFYAIRDVPGKGKGLVAVQKIKKGTRILCEEPIIITPQGEPEIPRLRVTVAQQVDALEPSLRQAFLSMRNIYPHENSVEKLYWGIFQTNALPVENGEIASAIFIEACRINHACDRNGQKRWNDNIKKHTVHALRDIEKGDEITICYLGVDMGRDSRMKTLEDKFAFVCSCRLCSLPAEEGRESDRRLDRIYQLDGLISRGLAFGALLSSPLQMLRYVDEQVRLYNEQGPDDSGLPQAFFDAAQIVIANGDLARGRIFAERAVSGWRTNSGSDCKENTAVDEVPSELEKGAFEDWLWKRFVPQREGQPADLRNRSSFPGFSDLPTDGGADRMDIFQDGVADDPHARPRHWCFLAEIVDYSLLLRLEMELKDVNEEMLPLFFYTEARGNELAPEDICRGYTVAVLDARHHKFRWDRPDFPGAVAEATGN
ncbi:hypothetical protein NPX13_g6170 [Xylaria arbuscula]|uniref:SET domain-containing protein n=1 Tax=Xylaria arbuscula TaxID=114810 RepID=A0A9W8NCY1_9PEZI|nr:hypothetical protein NPX13_g6170 [Xylaria arbuscula]